MNPGFDPQMQCLVLTKLENRYDHLMTQADNFGLSSSEVRAIWSGRFGDAVSWDMYCNSYEPRSEEDDRCRNLLGNACLFFLPGCQGACQFYTIRRPKKDIES